MVVLRRAATIAAAFIAATFVGGCSLSYGNYERSESTAQAAQVATMSEGDQAIERRAPATGRYVLTYVYRDGRHVAHGDPMRLLEGTPLGFEHTADGIEAFAGAHRIMVGDFPEGALYLCWTAQWKERRLVRHRGWHWESWREPEPRHSTAWIGGGGHVHDDDGDDDDSDKHRRVPARTASDRGQRYGDSTNNKPEARRRTRD